MRRYPAGLYNKKVLFFDGVDDYVHIPNSDLINTDGPYPNRTIEVLFKCYDVKKRQVIYEEGGMINGFNIYILNNKLYAGAWGEEIGWEGSWLGVSILPNNIYHAILILRNATDKIEPDKLELWINGSLIGKEQAAQVPYHSNPIGAGAVNSQTKFHDIGDVSFDETGYHFYGIIYLVRIYNRALSKEEVQYLKNNAFNLKSTSIRDGLVLEFIPDSLDCENGVWRDNSGNRNDGAIYGARCVYV